MKRCFFVSALSLFVAGCASMPEPAEPQRAGAYYKDDGPGDNPPPNLAELADAVPRHEPLHRGANRPYQVFGKQYVPLATAPGFRQRGIASWYGRRYHGQKTSNGESYDMYAMTAAHPTLPIPSYARITNLVNDRSVVVRINDRGPFHSERIVDLSYAAAYKLGFAGRGSTEVEVESIGPEEERLTASAPAAEPNAVYLQLGAFSSRENAEDFRARVARQLAWLSDAVQVLASGALWRLRVGPYASSEAARRVAERIETELNVKPLVVR